MLGIDTAYVYPTLLQLEIYHIQTGDVFVGAYRF